ERPTHVFPKVEAFADYLYVVTTPLAKAFVDRRKDPGASLADADQGVVTQLSTVLSDKLLITHHTEPLEEVENLRSFLFKHEEQAGRGPDYLFHLILDAMIDSFAPVVDRLHGELEAIEDLVFSRPTPDLLQRLIALKRLVIVLRKTTMYEREVLVRMTRGDFSQIDEREIAYYRFVYDHVVRFTEMIEGAREMIGDLMQLHLSATSNKMNEIMKVLAMISTILLPMTVISGFYGQNFAELPDWHMKWGWLMTLGAMLAFGGGAVAFFKWRRWF
ncbi:MAG: magnesium transporter CorA family protein, partial [Verrucomicrobiales bacterium]|nr:magnesium transporter CorA family protein [Verrucomicrobiales bacterium]